MLQLSLLELYTALKAMSSGHEYTAVAIKGKNKTFLARNSNGYPALIVETDSKFDAPLLKAAKVCFEPGQDFIISIDASAPIRGTYNVLVCESNDRNDIINFLILMDAFLGSVDHPQITGNDMAVFFRSMVRLFAVKPALDLEAKRQGLWGELFVMQQVSGYRFWAPFWHGAVMGLFDFSKAKSHVEVKTTVSTNRIHHFSHRQIWEAEGEEIIIASLTLAEDDSGLSLRELIDECRLTLRGTPDYLKLEFAIRHAGMEDDALSGPKFNADSATQNLLWFKAADAPHFRMPEPIGVSETSYKVDFTEASPISTEELNRWLGDWVTTEVPIIST